VRDRTPDRKSRQIRLKSGFGWKLRTLLDVSSVAPATTISAIFDYEGPVDSVKNTLTGKRVTIRGTVVDHAVAESKRSRSAPTPRRHQKPLVGKDVGESRSSTVFVDAGRCVPSGQVQRAFVLRFRHADAPGVAGLRSRGIKITYGIRQQRRLPRNFGGTST
jgi:hypothetical protein